MPVVPTLLTLIRRPPLRCLSISSFARLFGSALVIPEPFFLGRATRFVGKIRKRVFSSLAIKRMIAAVVDITIVCLLLLLLLCVVFLQGKKSYAHTVYRKRLVWDESYWDKSSWDESSWDQMNLDDSNSGMSHPKNRVASERSNPGMSHPGMIHPGIK